jgi:hypothetical protein
MLVAVSCAAVWYAIRAATGESFYLLVVPVSALIAITVRRTTTRRGIRVGVLAAVVTYLAASFADYPVLARNVEREAFEAASDEGARAKAALVGYGVALPLSCVVPILFAAESPDEHGPALATTMLCCIAAGVFASLSRRLRTDRAGD